MKKLIALLAIFVLASCSKEIEAPEVSEAPKVPPIENYLFCSTKTWSYDQDTYDFYINITEHFNSIQSDEDRKRYPNSSSILCMGGNACTSGLISKDWPHWFLSERFQVSTDYGSWPTGPIYSSGYTKTYFYDDEIVIDIYIDFYKRKELDMGFQVLGHIEISRMDLSVEVRKSYPRSSINDPLKPIKYEGQCKKISKEAFMFEYESEVKKKQLLIDKAVEEARKEKEEIIKKRVL